MSVGMLALFSVLSLAQSPHPGAPQGPMAPDIDPLKREFFPPELIMDNQKEVGITADQRKKLIAEIQAAQSRMVELQFEIKAQHELLADIVKKPAIDEAKAMAQVDKVMALENEIKKNHLRLLVRIKNNLTAEQQAKLRDLMQRLPPPMPSMPQAPQPPQR
jgi:Spy/CpxP family protein refolding chaperone